MCVIVISWAQSALPDIYALAWGECKCAYISQSTSAYDITNVCSTLRSRTTQ